MTDVLDAEEVASKLMASHYKRSLVYVRMANGTIQGVSVVREELDEDDGSGFSRMILELSDVTHPDP